MIYILFMNKIILYLILIFKISKIKMIMVKVYRWVTPNLIIEEIGTHRRKDTKKKQGYRIE